MSGDERAAITFSIRGPIARGELPGLCRRVCALFDAGGPQTADADVGAAAANAVTVDALARLQLAAKRRGCQVRLRGLSAELRELIELMGLEDVLSE